MDTTIRVKAMCIFERDGKTLGTKGYDPATGEVFYRLIGGGIEHTETSEVAVRREVVEEVASEISDLTFLECVENIFEYEGRPGHEIVFVYKGDLVREELYDMEMIEIREGDEVFEAFWIDVSDVVAGRVVLYPEVDYGDVFKKQE